MGWRPVPLKTAMKGCTFMADSGAAHKYAVLSEERAWPQIWCRQLGGREQARECIKAWHVTMKRESQESYGGMSWVQARSLGLHDGFSPKHIKTPKRCHCGFTSAYVKIMCRGRLLRGRESRHHFESESEDMYTSAWEPKTGREE